MTVLKAHSHPGEVLSELYLEPLGMSAIALARRLNVPREEQSETARNSQNVAESKGFAARQPQLQTLRGQEV